MQSLKEKVVLITGASSGIGAGTAVCFARLGSRLVLTGRNQENLEQTGKQCEDCGLSGNDILLIKCDIKVEEDRKKIIESTIQKFGKLDVLVNNAGINIFGPVITVTSEDYDNLMDTNMKSHVFLTQLAVPHLLKTKGNIVNVSSICAQNPMPEIAVYCMTKAAMDMFTYCLSIELAPKGVRVNAVNPGSVVSSIARRGEKGYVDDKLYKQFLEKQATVHPLGRVGKPEEIGNAIIFLASDMAQFITGDTLFIDGGRKNVSPGVATQLKKD